EMVMGDATAWDEEKYRLSILQERAVEARTVFRTVFAPISNRGNSPDILLAASSDGTVAPYSIPAYISTYVSGYEGPAYDLKFYGEGDDALLLSSGDDGRIQVWQWKEISDAFRNSWSVSVIQET
ncbi:hypothetical protein KI387_002871, partial [Taxus chinensis]